MSEIRKELEHFAHIEEQKSSSINEAKSAQTPNNKTIQTLSDKDECLKAPSGYSKEFAEKFASLPDDWRHYLSAREAEIDKGFGKLRSTEESHKFLENIYADRNGELQQHGIKTQCDWMKAMAKIDTMLSQRPVDAIKLLAEAYNVNLQPQQISSSSSNNRSLTQALQEQLTAKEVSDFSAAVDDKGNPLHPYIGEIYQDMIKLLSSGMVQTLNDAYETAVWFNPVVRNKMLAERTAKTLEHKSKEAQKSKEISFIPKGKGEINTKDMTLREELEMRFAALHDED